MYTIDMNCDCGESYGIYRMGHDEAIIPYVTSVNIACGFHAGDPSVMRRSVELALSCGVSIGAHPGLPDIVGFGRRYIEVNPEEVYDMLIYQVSALQGFVRSEGGELVHVKPHGALYHMAAKDAAIADAVTKAVSKLDDSLIIYAPYGSELMISARHKGLHTASEVFADRTYQMDGSLTPRMQANSVIHNSEIAGKQLIQMIQEQQVKTVEGKFIPIQADTVCVHGDHIEAESLVKYLRNMLAMEEIHVRPYHKANHSV